MPINFTCPHCQKAALVADEYAGQTGPCSNCGQPITIPAPGGPFAAGTPFRSPDLGENAAIRMLLPVGRSWLAIAAGYFGLFAILIFPAPIALLLGLLAIYDIRRHPEKHGMGRAIFGVVMGLLGIGLVVFMLMGAWLG